MAECHCKPLTLQEFNCFPSVSLHKALPQHSGKSKEKRFGRRSSPNKATTFEPVHTRGVSSVSFSSFCAPTLLPRLSKSPILPGFGPLDGPAREKQQSRHATSAPRHPAVDPRPPPAPTDAQKVPRAVGNGSCLPLASCFPCNLIGRQAHQNKDGLAALAGTSLRRILRQERRSEWRGVGKGREAEWLESGGGRRGRGVVNGCLGGWMDGLSDPELNGYDCVYATAAGLAERSSAGWAACLDKVTRTSSFLLWE